MSVRFIWRNRRSLQVAAGLGVSSYAMYKAAGAYYAPEPCDTIVLPTGEVYRVGIDSAEGPPITHNRKKKLPPEPEFAMVVPDRI